MSALSMRLALSHISALANQAMQAPPPFDLVAHLTRQREFSMRTFGPGPRVADVVSSVRSELHAIEARPDELGAWILVALTAFEGAWRAGFSPDEIARALTAKLAFDEARHAAPADQTIEHVRRTA